MNGKLSFAQRLAKQAHTPPEETHTAHSSTTKQIPLQNTRRGYLSFREEYDGLKDILKMLETGKRREISHSPVLRSITPAKPQAALNPAYPMKAASLQLAPNCEEKENQWEAGWLCTEREDYRPTFSQTLPKSEPVIPQRPREISAETSAISKKGIPNHGNTCYINSLLQCLFHLPHFNEYFSRNSFQAESFESQRNVVEMYTALLRNLTHSNPQAEVSTLPLKQAVSKICSLFLNWQQEDAHEFMKKLLNSMHDELNRVKVKGKYRELFREVAGLPLEKMAAAYWAYEREREDSYIYDNFCGQLYSSVRCVNCECESETFENFLDLSLPLTPSAHSLQELLQEYFEPEKLSDFYLCSNCHKSSKKSVKSLQLWRAPKFLIVHLKRSQLERKNIDAITIPEGLTLKPFMDASNDRTAKFCQYSLCGIVMHQGVLEGGHYWANVRENGRWFEMDDQKVREVEGEGFRRGLAQGNSSAYILFYSSLYC